MKEPSPKLQIKPGFRSHPPKVRLVLIYLITFALITATFALAGLFWAVSPALSLGLSLLALLALLYALLVEPRWIEVTRVEIALPRLPQSLDGLVIVHISDIHFGPLVQEGWVRRVVERTNGEKPDLVLLTGDYVAHRISYIEPVAGLLGEIKARLGAYAVLGNHDHWADGPMLAETFTRQGIPVLINRHLKLNHSPSPLWLVGVDDPYMGRDDLGQALEGVPDEAFKILLAHSPDIMEEAKKHRIDLVTAGHTHGGQVRLPGIKTLVPASRLTRFEMGLYREEDTALYVSRGVGKALLPFRLFCRPELAILTLRQGNGAALTNAPTTSPASTPHKPESAAPTDYVTGNPQ